ncbi:MAG: hypothetical protein QOE66_120, partial [Chloroflexota bacterium]|nr:hypothetical protein [Chloroflexota bacterium]
MTGVGGVAAVAGRARVPDAFLRHVSVAATEFRQIWSVLGQDHAQLLRIRAWQAH